MDVVNRQLLQAAARGDLGLLQSCLEHGGANVEATDPEDGETSLLVACRNGDLEMSHYLVTTHNANIAALSPSSDPEPGYNALHYACESGNLDLIRFLIDLGLDPQARSGNMYTPFHSICCFGMLPEEELDADRRLAVVRFLAENYDLNIDMADLHVGDTPLHCASCCGYDRVVDYLLSRGANVGARNLSHGTPLHSACTGGDFLRTVQCLCAHGADVRAGDIFGQLPVHIACSNGALNLVRYFLESHNLDVETKDGWNHSTLLHRACGGNPARNAPTRRVVEHLLEQQNANLCARNGYGGTPFDVICHGVRDTRNNDDRARIPGMLLNHYAAQVRSLKGPNAIHDILLRATYRDTVKRLVQPPVRSLQVDLPIGTLEWNHFQTLLQTLLGADAMTFQRPDADGALALHIACGSGAPVRVLRLFVEMFPFALQVPNNKGMLPLHLLLQTNPPVDSVEYLIRSFEGSVLQRSQSGHLPVMIASEAGSSQDVLMVLLLKFPDALLYMRAFYGS